MAGTRPQSAKGLRTSIGAMFEEWRVALWLQPQAWDAHHDPTLRPRFPDARRALLLLRHVAGPLIIDLPSVLTRPLARLLNKRLQGRGLALGKPLHPRLECVLVFIAA